jgi:hypothetical protein
MSNIEIKKFDMKKIRSDSVVVLIGKRDTGKSFLCKDLLYHNMSIPVGVVISGTESANSFYKSMVPKMFIHNEFTPGIIQNTLKRQKMVIKKLENEKTQQGYSNINPNAFLILDDCLYDNCWVKDKNIRSCFMNGRHFKLLFILTMQYALGITPNLRTNIDYVFILRENYISNRKKLYEHYAGMFPTFDIFNQVMNQCTENYECLVIHNNAKSNKLEDQVFWYKAVEHPPFRLGPRLLWENQENNMDDGCDEDDNFNNQFSNKKLQYNIKKGS